MTLTSGKAITRAKLAEVVADAAAVALAERALPGGALAEARRVAEDVTADPRLARALEPISRFESQTLRGIVIAAGAPLLIALGRLSGVEIAEGDAATVVATLLSLAGAAYAWFGRETTTRPLA